jgi:hypothetical protein
MLYPQMPAQEFGAKATLEAHHILGPYRLPDRYRRLAGLHHRQRGLPKTGKRAMHLPDQFDELLGSELMMPRIAADNVRDSIEITLRRRGLRGHVCAPLIINLGRSLLLAEINNHPREDVF